MGCFCVELYRRYTRDKYAGAFSNKSASMNTYMLRCPACFRNFGLSVGTGAFTLSKLSDPFQAICIHCKTVSAFYKNGVVTASIKGLSENRLKPADQPAER